MIRRTKGLALAALLTALVATPLLGQAGWQPLPVVEGMGQIYDLIRDRSGILFALSRGTIYSSDDGGASWRMVPGPEGGPTLYGAAIDSSGALLVGGHGDQLPGMPVLFRSTDKGVTWTPLPTFPATTGGNLMVAPDGTYVGASPAIYRSTTEGATWDSIPLTVVSINSIIILPNGLLIVDERTIGPAYSIDGVTWTPIELRNVRGSTHTFGPVAALDSLRMFTIVRNNYSDHYLFRTFDGGRTWSQSAPLPSGLSTQAITVNDRGEVVVQVTNGDLYRSSNMGISWNRHGTGPGETIFSFLRISGDTLLAAAPDGPFRSVDGGVSWRQWAGGTSQMSVMGFTPMRGGMAIATVEHGVMVYAHESGSLRKIAPASTGITNVSSLEDNTLIASKRLFLFQSNEENSAFDTLKEVFGFDAGVHTMIGDRSRMLIVAGGFNGDVELSNDTGTSWHPITVPVSPGEMRRITNIARSPEGVLYTRSANRLFRLDSVSVDDPAATVSTPIFDEGTYVSAFFAGKNGALLCATDSAITLSADFGERWAALPSFPETTEIYSAAIGEGGRIYVVARHLEDGVRWVHEVYGYDEETGSWTPQGFSKSSENTLYMLRLFVDLTGSVYLDDIGTGLFIARAVSGVEEGGVIWRSLDLSFDAIDRGGE